MKCGSYLSALIVLGMSLSGSPAASSEIFTWIDDDGVVHFSDGPPADDGTYSKLHVNASNPPDYDPANDPNSIANQAKRMNRKWTALAKAREERLAERREQPDRYAQNLPPRYDGWRYDYWPRYRPPLYPVRPPPEQRRTVRHQVEALDTLNLTGPRPHSINSGAHHARVTSSSHFRSAVAKPPPRPTPR